MTLNTLRPCLSDLHCTPNVNIHNTLETSKNSQYNTKASRTIDKSNPIDLTMNSFLFCVLLDPKGQFYCLVTSYFEIRSRKKWGNWKRLKWKEIHVQKKYTYTKESEYQSSQNTSLVTKTFVTVLMCLVIQTESGRNVWK